MMVLTADDISVFDRWYNSLSSKAKMSFDAKRKAYDEYVDNLWARAFVEAVKSMEENDDEI
jgi:hypothetical protein